MCKFVICLSVPHFVYISVLDWQRNNSIIKWLNYLMASNHFNLDCDGIVHSNHQSDHAKEI